MEAHQRTRFTGRGLTICGDADEHVDLYAGAMHYWRVDRADWRGCLRAMRRMGLRIVDTYVPWGVHEDDDGDLSWSDHLDLRAFLYEVAAADMKAIVRPGPHVNAELTRFGFPERIVADADMQAVSARDTPVWLPVPPQMFPVPSYASKSFQAAVRKWYAAVGKIVKDHLAPDGPVVAVQVDNEAQMFFRVGAYDHDYHKDSLAWWDEFAGGIEPPRAWDPGDPGRCAKWVAFKDEYVARSLAWLSKALDDAGFAGVARFHNYPPAEPTLIDLPRGQEAVGGPCGVDFYHRAQDRAVYERRALHLVGSADPIPFAPEVGVGGPPWLLPMTEADQRTVLLSLLAAGVRGFNLFMTVERERWYGAAISDRGELRPAYQWLKTLIEALDQVKWPTLRRHTSLALVQSRADARFGVASSLADPITPVVTELAGLADALSLDDDARAHRKWMTALTEALARARVPYAIVDESCPVERLTAFDAVVMPTLHRVDRAAWLRLRAVADSETAVVIGPGKPSRDELDAPLGADAAIPKGVGRINPASLDDPDALAGDLASIVGGVAPEWTVEDGVRGASYAFADPEGQTRCVFVANRTEGRHTARVNVPGGAVLVDALTGVAVGDAIELGGYEVRMFRVDVPAA